MTILVIFDMETESLSCNKRRRFRKGQGRGSHSTVSTHARGFHQATGSTIKPTSFTVIASPHRHATSTRGQRPAEWQVGGLVVGSVDDDTFADNGCTPGMKAKSQTDNC